MAFWFGALCAIHEGTTFRSITPAAVVTSLDTMHRHQGCIGRGKTKTRVVALASASPLQIERLPALVAGDVHRVLLWGGA